MLGGGSGREQRHGQVWGQGCAGRGSAGMSKVQGAVPSEGLVACTSGLMWCWLGFAEKADGTAVDIFSFGMCALEVRSRTAAVTPGYRAGLLLRSLLGIVVAGEASRGVSSPFSRPHCDLWGSLAVMETPLLGSAEHSLLPCPPCPGCSNRLSSPLLCLAGASRPSAGASSSSSGCDSPGKGGHRGQGHTVLLQEGVHADCGAAGAVCIVPPAARCSGSSLQCLPWQEPVSSLERCGRQETGLEGRDAAAGGPRRSGPSGQSCGQSLRQVWPGCVPR